MEYKDPFDVLITNPPYSLAQEFVEHAWEIASPGAKLILLLRVNFFGGQKRSKWLKNFMPIECHVTPRRPKFTGKGTDSTEYARFVWQKGLCPPFTKTYLLDTAK